MTGAARGRAGLIVVAAIVGVAGVALAAGGVVLQAGEASGEASPPPASDEPSPVPPAGEASAPPEPAEPEVAQVGAGGIAALADPRWVADVSARSGIPERALAAYAGAAIAVEEEHQGCALGWNTLAGIGLVESDHGSAHGATLGADGVVSPAIIGIALDGRETARIPDTDDGLLDGDTRWDRAVGPLQFIPSTWQAYGRDGNGDGVADPHQIDDAAASAADYLCAVGGDLSQPANWIAAVGDYNPSIDYNNRVAEAADAYAAFG
ncbi:MAG: lytic murein transglycosylase [Microbacterium sp.]